MKKISASHAELAAKRENEIWLYSYADLITNLMAFFIVMLVMSRADVQTSQKIKDSLAKMVGKRSSATAVVSDDEIVNSISQLILENQLGSNIAVDTKTDGLSLTFSGGVFFETSSSELTPAAKDILDRVSPIFMKLGKEHRIDVEGHADARPLRGSDVYPSNWELSAARAGAVVRYLSSKGVSPQKMRAIGYAETRPVSQDWQTNRRVVISIGKGLK